MPHIYDDVSQPQQLHSFNSCDSEWAQNNIIPSEDNNIQRINSTKINNTDNANPLLDIDINERQSHAGGSLFPELKGFKVCQINIASLIKHYDEFLLYMQNRLFDIITLNETRLDSSVLNGEIEITGYDIVRRDPNRSRGGVAMYIRSHIPYTIRNDLTI